MSGLHALVENSPDLQWLEDAACAEMGVDDFFVDAGHVITPEALDVCRSCPVRVECLTHSYEQGLSAGYFGGVSPGQRRTLTLEEALAYVAEDKD